MTTWVQKATGQLTWGSADVINIHFAHMDKDEVTKSKHIGLMYSSVGIGCLLGPIFANNFTDMEHPRSLQFACVSALGVISFGWVGMSMSTRIEWLCFFNTVRAFGSAIIWINSTLLLQVSRRNIVLHAFRRSFSNLIFRNNLFCRN